MSPTPSDSVFNTLKRVYRLLNEKERKRSVLLLLSIFANSIVEILGLAVIVPVIGLVVQPEQIQTNTYLKRAFDLTSTLGIDTPNHFLILLCALMIGAFLFKALFGLAVNLFQTRFSFAVAHRLAGQMWTYHFSQSLERMRGTDSGRILSEINVWPIQFALAFMVGGLMILTEISVIALITIGLLAYNTLVFVSIAGLLSLGAFIIRKVTKQWLIEYSDVRKKLEPHTNTLITNAIRGFLELVTLRASNAMRDAYLKDRKTIFRISSNTTVLNLAPAKLYEVLAVTAVAGSIIIALIQGKAGSDFLQLLSFMAISAYRVMPSMSRLNGAVMQLRGQQYVLDAMEPSLHHNATPISKKTVNLPGKASVDIDLKGITLTYENLDIPVIQNLECRFAAGRLHGIVGQSGSGKSTLVNSLLGLHTPHAGQIKIDINNSLPVNLHSTILLNDWIMYVGYLSQQPFLFQGTVRDNLTLRVPDASINENLVDRLIVQLGLRDCLGASPMDFELQEGGSNLSGGQQQRLALVRALQTNSSVLILDEATSALDHKLRDVVFELLKQRAENGCNVILVTHDLEIAQKCDVVLDLNNMNQH